MDIKEKVRLAKLAFDSSNITCCGTSDFSTRWSSSDTGMGVIYLFYSTCKKCNAHWSMTSKVIYSGRMLKDISSSEPVRVDDKKWRLMDMERFPPL